MKSINSESILLPTYLLMMGVAVCLNIFSGSGYDPINIIITICMFLIVGGIILWANSKCFFPVNRMMSSLRYTIQTMEIDFDKTGSYLWPEYKDEPNLFNNKILNQRFNEYRLERKRLNMLSETGTKCDIEDYINEYFIDAKMKKGLLSIIPGVMTGLGILGTFIGLAFGLQNFDTSNAEAITNSIAPLMDGIKIAFHTSIYGMVFSLIFNFVYKKNLEDAYNTVDRFLEAYHKYVLPKTENDDISILLNFQEKQMQQMEEMMESFSDKLAVKIADAIRNPYNMQ